MDRIEKFVRRLSKKQRKQVINVIQSLLKDELDHLDIKPLKGGKGWYRCRIGDIRIIFIRMSDGGIKLMDINFRGTVYKRL